MCAKKSDDGLGRGFADSTKWQPAQSGGIELLANVDQGPEAGITLAKPEASSGFPACVLTIVPQTPVVP
jgi:hypothetical protein